MERKVIRDYFQLLPEKNIGMLAMVRQKVVQGLDLERGTAANLTAERTMVVDTIAETMIEVCDILNIDIPEIGRTYDWGDLTSEQGEYWGVATASEKGAIKYSPLYLRGIIEGLNKGNREKEIKRLVSDTAHELCHEWQWRNFNNDEIRASIVNDIKWITYSREHGEILSLDERPLSKWERDARAFGQHFQESKSKRLRQNQLQRFRFSFGK